MEAMYLCSKVNGFGMIQEDFLQEILKQQKESVSAKDAGMRRCGKRTLLLYQKKKHIEAMYVNFDDSRFSFF